jgi:hypothetical protein
MLLAIVLLVFALHVVAWLVLPMGRRARVDRAGVRLHRHVATTMPMGAPMEG